MFQFCTSTFIQAEVRQAGSHVIAWHKVHRAKLADINSTMVSLYSGNGLLLTEDCLGKVGIYRVVQKCNLNLF